MRKTLTSLLSALIVLSAMDLQAQVPDTFNYTLEPPSGTPLVGTKQGRLVAIDGNLVVVSANDEQDASEGGARGVVRVYQFSTGALLGKLFRPASLSPAAVFGTAVAISGNRIAVASDAGQSVHVFDLGSATPLRTVLTINSPVFSNAFGSAVAVSGTTLIVGASSQIVSGTSAAGAAYVFDLGSATPDTPAYLIPNPVPHAQAYFGKAVSVAGTRIVVGAPQDDVSGKSRTGSAYAFDLAGATPTVPTATLINPDRDANDFFGTAVSISGTKVVIGTPGDTVGGFSGAGSAYVYDVAGATPGTAVFTLNNNTPALQENFGSSVAIAGTGIAIGAPYDSTAAVNSGRTVIYNLLSGTPTTPVYTLANPSPGANDNFGISVAASGARVVVGSPGDDLVASDSGATHFYDFTSATPTVPIASVAEIVAQFFDNFASAVAVSGNHVVVGVPGDDAGGLDAGCVYVFDLSSATPQTPVLTLSNSASVLGPFFGSAVAIDVNRIMVSAPNFDSGTGRLGAVLVYDLSSGTPSTPVRVLVNPNGNNASDSFGKALAIVGTKILVGAPTYNPSSTFAGRAYLFDLSSATPAVPVLTMNDPGSGSDRFGSAVAMSGTRLLIGAPYDSTGASNTGRAYVFDTTSGTPATPTVTLISPSPNGSDYFGWAVAISDTIAAVGSPYDAPSGSGTGRVHLYDLSSATPAAAAASISSPSELTDGFFGGSLAMSGLTLLVGAPNSTVVSPLRINAGRAYLYDLGSPTPLTPAVTYTRATQEEGDLLGGAVALSATHAVIGSQSAKVNGLVRGHADIFGIDPTLPDIAVEEPVHNDLIDGVSTVTFPGTVLNDGGSVKTFTIRNVGNDVLTVTAIGCINGNASDFDVATPTLPRQIAPNASTTFTVRFLPSVVGTRTTTLRIVNDDPTEYYFDVTLTGNGVAPVPGALDPSFAPNVIGTVYGIAPLADGRVVVAGSLVNGNIRRYFSDGSTDPTFTPTTNGPVFAVLANADGSMIFGGDFTTVGATTRNRIARFGANSTLDTSFNPNLNGRVFAMAAQPDGKIIVGGEFTSVGGTTRNYIARLNADGSLDTTFDASITFAANVQSIALQSDGKIVIAGLFYQIGGVSNSLLRRLNTDGTLDTTFTPAVDNTVQSVAVQADGRIIACGAFATINGTSAPRIARLNTNGTVDTSFSASADGMVQGLALQADGRILMGGFFTTVNGMTRNHIARLNTDGTLDSTFDPNVSDLVYGVAVRHDGEVYVGGIFGSVGGQPRASIARLDNDIGGTLGNVVDTSLVRWFRAGSVPEATEVTFDLSTDAGATWSPLGNASRTTGGWQKSGLNLPAAAQIRARARTSGGWTNGSSGTVEEVFAYTGAQPPANPRIVSTRLNGSLFIIDFTAKPGLTGWTMKGSLDLASFPLNLTSNTSFQELSAGNYRATVLVTGNPTRAFFKIER